MKKATVWTGQSSSAGSQERKFFNVTAYVSEGEIGSAERARWLANKVLEIYPGAGELDDIQITVVHGFDIGIASSWRAQNHANSPSKWYEQL